jgi:hypothetical protein
MAVHFFPAHYLFIYFLSGGWVERRVLAAPSERAVIFFSPNLSSPFGFLSLLSPYAVDHMEGK